MSNRIFYPVSSRDFTPHWKPGQRYRHPFGDLRLSRRVDQLSSLMLERQSIVINQLSDKASEKKAFYELLNNPYVELSELIDHSCQMEESLVVDQSLLCLLDTTSTSLVSRLEEKRQGNPTPGVVEDNRTPGFYAQAAIVAEEYKKYLLGLGDLVFYDRPKNELKGPAAKQARNERAKLALEEKESYVWPLAAANTHQRLQKAKQVTYVMDQGGDKYEALLSLRKQTQGADFIVRSKENRQAIEVLSGRRARLRRLLQDQRWMQERQVAIRALDHYSKSSGKRVVRQGRSARLRIRYIRVQLCVPDHLQVEPGYMDGLFSVVEVKEDPDTVPPGEQPIHWRLLTTREVDSIEQAWHIVECYQFRWFIEQLFRVYKKKGFDMEHSQIKGPDAVKKQAVLAIKAATQVMQLTMARQGRQFIPLQTVFPHAQEKLVLDKLNDKLSGKTPKTTNPHPPNSLAYAAWLIARLGGWNGYEKQRPPGPITMHRGLKRFYSIIWADDLMNAP